MPERSEVRTVFDAFVGEAMPPVMLKCIYDKAFISNLAKKATTNACKTALVPSLA